MITYNTNATINFNNIGNSIRSPIDYKCFLFDVISSTFNEAPSDGYTSTYEAIKEAANVFKLARESSKKVVVLITDGPSNIGPPPASASHLLHSLSWGQNSTHDEVTIFCLGIKQADIGELLSLSTDLPYHAVVIEDYKYLDLEQRKLFNGLIGFLITS